MDRLLAIAAIHEIAEYLGDGVRDDYSGRGMYGKTCYGIVTDDPLAVVEDAAAVGLRGARTDSMGTHTIVYWPAVTGRL